MPTGDFPAQQSHQEVPLVFLYTDLPEHKLDHVDVLQHVHPGGVVDVNHILVDVVGALVRGMLFFIEVQMGVSHQDCHQQALTVPGHIVRDAPSPHKHHVREPAGHQKAVLSYPVHLNPRQGFFAAHRHHHRAVDTDGVLPSSSQVGICAVYALEPAVGRNVKQHHAGDGTRL